MLVDHFAMLGLGPSATPDEIKSAYRKLARQFHPDLNPNSAESSDRFRAIQAAYETLSRPHLRQAYLEKRWYAQYRNQPLDTQPITLERVLRESIELERFVAMLDPYRMDRAGLEQHLLQRIRAWQAACVSPENSDLVEQVLEHLVQSARKLNMDQAESVHRTLQGWLRSNNLTELLTDEWLIKKRRLERWERSMPLLALFFTILLSVIIWLAAR